MRRLEPKAIREAFQAQLEAALAQIDKRMPSDEEIHVARKCIKKARATLRLLRETLGTAVYQRENQALRDAAHPLSATRDAKVLADVLDFMAKKRAIDPTSAQALRHALDRNRKRLDRQIASRSGVAASRRTLRSVARRASRWSSNEGDAALIIRALRRMYRRGRRAMSKAQADRSAELLHEWRKQVKYLWHQLQMLEPAQPGIREIAESAHRLSDYLGQDHDLAVLRNTVLARRRLFSRRALKATVQQIEKRRLALERKSFSLGQVLFCEKPSTFAERFGGAR